VIPPHRRKPCSAGPRGAQNPEEGKKEGKQEGRKRRPTFSLKELGCLGKAILFSLSLNSSGLLTRGIIKDKKEN